MIKIRYRLYAMILALLFVFVCGCGSTLNRISNSISQENTEMGDETESRSALQASDSVFENGGKNIDGWDEMSINDASDVVCNSSSNNENRARNIEKAVDVSVVSEEMVAEDGAGEAYVTITRDDRSFAWVDNGEIFDKASCYYEEASLALIWCCECCSQSIFWLIVSSIFPTSPSIGSDACVDQMGGQVNNDQVDMEESVYLF